MDKYSIIDFSSPWIRRDFHLWETLTSGKKPLFFPQKAFLYSQGEPAKYGYVIKEGRVRVTTYHERGMEKQLFICESGAICGTDVIAGEIYATSALALTSVIAYRFTCDELLEAGLKNNGKLAHLVMKDLLRKNHIYQEQIVSLSFYPAIQRIAHVLLNLRNQYGIPHKNGTLLKIKFTQQDIATMISASRVSVNMAFNKLYSLGVLEKADGYIVLKDLEFIEQIADGKSNID